jgi:hypothetical protein
MEKVKNCYEGKFNYSRQIYTLYCHAYTEAQAKEVFFRRLAKLHDVSVWTVRNHFDGQKDNFRITKEGE